MILISAAGRPLEKVFGVPITNWRAKAPQQVNKRRSPSASPAKSIKFNEVLYGDTPQAAIASTSSTAKRQLFPHMPAEDALFQESMSQSSRVALYVGTFSSSVGANFAFSVCCRLPNFNRLCDPCQSGGGLRSIAHQNVHLISKATDTIPPFFSKIFHCESICVCMCVNNL